MISFCVIVLLCDLNIYTSFQSYMIMFGLTLFGIDDLWLLFLVLSWRLAESDVTFLPTAMSLSCQQQSVLIDYVSDIIRWLI